MTDKLRVLLVAPIRFYNAEAEYIHRLARGLKDRGHEPVVMGIPGSPLIRSAQMDGIETYTGFPIVSQNPVKLLTHRGELNRFLETGGFHVVNIHRSEGFIVIALAAHNLVKRPAIIRTRGDMRPVRRDPLNRRLYGKLCDRVIASNMLLEQELMVRLGLPRDKICTIYMGIDPDEQAPSKTLQQAREELGIRDGERVIGLLGRIGPVKGQDCLLEAAPKIMERAPEARFLLIYQMIERNSDFMQMLARSDYRDRFIMAGPNKNRADLMQVAEVAVIPSLGSEANCRAALEWMALAKPLVGSRVGVIPEIIDNAETGYLVPPRIAGALADAVINMFDHPERAREMGQNARRRLQSLFTQEKMVDETVSLYREVMAGIE